ncbi:hypothetical protein THAOC_26679, partial [Thalassiosira oceanica]
MPPVVRAGAKYPLRKTLNKMRPEASRTEPLAPPADINNTSRTFPKVTQVTHQRKSSGTWIPWLSLSPRIRRRPDTDEGGDQNKCRGKARIRSASFDHERSSDGGYSKKSSIEDSLMMARASSIIDSSSP